MVQPPIDPNTIIHMVQTAVIAITAFVTANPLIAVFLLAAIAIVAEFPPIVGILVLLVIVSFLIPH